MHIDEITEKGFTITKAELQKDARGQMTRVIFLHRVNDEGDIELWFVWSNTKGIEHFADPERVWKVCFYGVNGEDELVDYSERPMNYRKEVAIGVAEQMADEKKVFAWAVPA